MPINYIQKIEGKSDYSHLFRIYHECSRTYPRKIQRKHDSQLALTSRRDLSKLFAGVSTRTQNKIFGIIYKLAGRPKTSDHKWGEHHAFDQQKRLGKAVKIVLSKALKKCPSLEKVQKPGCDLIKIIDKTHKNVSTTLKKAPRERVNYLDKELEKCPSFTKTGKLS